MKTTPVDSATPLEFCNAVPVPVRAFAQQLVERRQLAAPVELTGVPSEQQDAKMFLGDALQALGGHPGFDECLEFVAYWAERFGYETDASELSVRLVHSRRPTCPRFHMDNVSLRLISTLMGPGSEWLRAEDVRYLEDCSISQNPRAEDIQRMDSYSVGMFPGKKNALGYPGVVHRSPQAMVDRLVMTMDLVA
ncbi:MAG: DUF1826 domain-containing protein [Pseudomonadota bacterium]